MAITRVSDKEHLLIYRPFDREMFTQGEREGPVLLLKHLRGEKLDWKEIEEKYMPSKRCVGCNFVQFKDAFPEGQWNREDKISFCKICTAKKRGEGTPWRCNNCGLWKSEAAFTQKFHHNWCLRTRVCLPCDERRVCRGKCGEAKGKLDFTDGEWERAGWPHSAQGKNKKCMSKNQETKVCGGCKKDFGRVGFQKAGGSDDQWFSKDSDRRCVDCRKKQAGMWKCTACS